MGGTFGVSPMTSDARYLVDVDVDPAVGVETDVRGWMIMISS